MHSHRHQQVNQQLAHQKVDRRTQPLPTIHPFCSIPRSRFSCPFLSFTSFVHFHHSSSDLFIISVISALLFPSFFLSYQIITSSHCILTRILLCTFQFFICLIISCSYSVALSVSSVSPSSVSPSVMPMTAISTFQVATSNMVTTFAGSGTYPSYPTATYPGMMPS